MTEIKEKITLGLIVRRWVKPSATRPADLETPIGAFLRPDDGGPAYLLESVEGGERLGRYSFLGVGPRRLLEVRGDQARIQTRPVTVPVYAPDLPVETLPVKDPLAAIRAFVPRRRVQPTEGMPRFTGGAVGALAYDAISSFEPSVPLPERDPVNVPLAAFIETDLVLVFDHLTHTLSAIASLHTETPNLEGRYRIAEAAIFDSSRFPVTAEVVEPARLLVVPAQPFLAALRDDFTIAVNESLALDVAESASKVPAPSSNATCMMAEQRFFTVVCLIGFTSSVGAGHYLQARALYGSPGLESRACFAASGARQGYTPSDFPLVKAFENREKHGDHGRRYKDRRGPKQEPASPTEEPENEGRLQQAR